ncbi:MAG: glycosyltransferase family 4 protein [Patescibacteria group bacterium]
MSGLPKMYYIANARMPTEKAHGIQIAKMCEAFIEAGVGVELVVPRRGKETRTLGEFYGLRVDVSMTRLWTPDWYGSRIGFAASSFLFALRYFLHLARRHYIARERFIIYTTDLDQFSFFPIPFLGIPYFVEMHDAKKKKWPFRLLFWRARGGACVNRIIQSELNDVFNLQRETLLVLPNAVDLSAFGDASEDQIAARDALGIPHGALVIMYVGQMYGWKGIEILPIVARRMPRHYFYIVGGTAEEMRAIGAMDEQPSNLVCVGYKPFQEIPRWLRAANILVATGTSKDPYSYLHTSPMKLFEYAAARRPIIAAQTPAISEIFAQRGGLGVFFYDPDDSEDLERAINAVLIDKDGAVERTEIALDIIAQHQWKYRAERMIEFMKSRL